MKIATLVTSLYSQGAEYVTAAMARGFFAAGHQVDVVVTAVHGDLAKTMTDRKPFALTKGIRLVQLPHRHSRENIWALRNYIRENRPDVFLCNAAPSIYAMILANKLLPRKYRTRIINVEHLSGIGLDAKGNRIYPAGASLKGLMMNALLRQADAIFTVSEGTRLAINRCRDYPLEKIHTVYNPAVDEVTDAKLQLPAMHPWLQDKTMPVFVSAGALTGWKNFELLVRAFARVRTVKPCRLIVFGEGPRRLVLENLALELGIATDVSLPGYTNQLPAEMKAADAFVVSSDVESFSIVLVEAMAAGVAIVSTDAPYGPPEILKNGTFGRLVPRNDCTALARAMTEVLDGKGRVVPQSRVDDFRTENIVRLYERALEKVLHA